MDSLNERRQCFSIEAVCCRAAGPIVLPETCLQWEDFATAHARPIFQRYRDQLLMILAAARALGVAPNTTEEELGSCVTASQWLPSYPAIAAV
jgi:hypothetical protein